MLSPRLLAVVDALPLTGGERVLEIGCGPGAAAREVAARLPTGYVLATDRSAAAIRQASQSLPGNMAVRQVAGEDFELEAGEAPFDLVFAVRVGALDGRHPELGERIIERLVAATTPAARLFVDGREQPLR